MVLEDTAVVGWSFVEVEGSFAVVGGNGLFEVLGEILFSRFWMDLHMSLDFHIGFPLEEFSLKKS